MIVIASEQSERGNLTLMVILSELPLRSTQRETCMIKSARPPL